MAAAQAVVDAVDQESPTSVEESLAALSSAHRVCSGAGLSSEAAQLKTASERFTGHLARLRERDEKRAARDNINPERLKELLRSGDPDCPKGQGYQHKASGKEIRCTGPVLVEMPRAEAERQLSRRGLRPVPTAPAHVLQMELGAERITLHYPPGDASAPPTCVVLHPPPGRSWQEVTAAATGITPDKLKLGRPLTTSRGELALTVDEKNVIVTLGSCPR